MQKEEKGRRRKKHLLLRPTNFSRGGFFISSCTLLFSSCTPNFSLLPILLSHWRTASSSCQSWLLCLCITSTNSMQFHQLNQVIFCFEVVNNSYVGVGSPMQ